MKSCILIFAICVLGNKIAQAQVDNKAAKADSLITAKVNEHPYCKNPCPLYIIKSHNKEFTLDSAYHVNIAPQWIESINVVHNSMPSEKYGVNALKNDMLIITIKDEDCPEAFKTLKKGMKKIKHK